MTEVGGGELNTGETKITITRCGGATTFEDAVLEAEVMIDPGIGGEVEGADPMRIADEGSVLSKGVATEDVVERMLDGREGIFLTTRPEGVRVPIPSMTGGSTEAAEEEAPTALLTKIP